jgi:hypothetical protein
VDVLILVFSDGPHQLGIIPQRYRDNIIESLKNSKFKDNPVIQAAVLELQTIDRSQEHWVSFIARQLLLDKRRSESWFDNLPIRDKLFQELAYNTDTWIS